MPAMVRLRFTDDVRKRMRQRRIPEEVSLPAPLDSGACTCSQGIDVS